MPIDVDKLVGARLDGEAFSWDDDDVMLYGLAVGAGDPPTDPSELKYVYEGDLAVVPSFGTIPPFATMMGVGAVAGLDINLAQILHGSHELVIHDDIPTKGQVSQSGQITDVFDRGRGAVVMVEVQSVLEKTGRPLFTNRAGIYVRGEGGFGGDPGTERGDHPPDSPPDLEVDVSTLPTQALLYRLASGDRNPLHADLGFASFAGFERPILHGLCTYGMVAKTVVEEALDGDPARVGSYRARFTGHVFPGETLTTRIWDTGDGLVLEVEAKERGARVLANAAVQPRR